jgi:sulfide:quinone oxidoreductase
MVPAEIPGLSEHANTIWSPEETLKLRESFGRLAGDARQGHSRKVVFLVPPNNKCSGPLYEMVMMLDSWLRRDHEGVRDNVEIVFETFEPEFLMVFGPRLHEVVSSEFAERRITGHNRRVVERVEPGEVIFSDGERQSFDLLVTFPPYRASTQFDTLPVDDRGFIKVDAETRRVEGYANLYAVGDTGDFPVKQAFLALLQADTASDQVAAAVLGTKPELPFDPVSMCIMEQFDKATFANVPLELTGDPGRPVRVRQGAQGQYKVGSGGIWRIGKMMLGLVLPYRFRHGAPFHAGPVWKVMELGLNVMRGLFAR